MSPSFAELGVPADLATALARGGITEPFPIQASTLPPALAGRDVCGKAPTGSGKTLAFGLALLTRVPKAQPRRPTALVLVPTRELAAQVRDELQPLAAAVGRTVGAVYGGTGYDGQRRILRRGLDVLVACPGRLEDLLSNDDLRLDAVDVVVLDEADRMADMGFLPSVKRILDQTPRGRQTLLFSATLDGDVDVLIRRYQDHPVTHEVEVDETETGDVTHHFWTVDRAARLGLTAALIRRHGSSVVFCRTKHGADRLARQLGRLGIGAVAIHGNRSQGQRERALADFAGGRALALVATDVAARGIHVDDVACVIHFDPPPDPKDYVHRSGRTGRAGADGVVVTLVSPDLEKATRSMLRGTDLHWAFDQPDDAIRTEAAALARQPDTRASASKSPSAHTSATAQKAQSGPKGHGANAKGSGSGRSSRSGPPRRRGRSVSRAR